jgi:hypothetical protein
MMASRQKCWECLGWASSRDGVGVARGGRNPERLGNPTRSLCRQTGTYDHAVPRCEPSLQTSVPEAWGQR